MRYLLLGLFPFSLLLAFNIEIVDANVANGKSTLLEFTKEKGCEFQEVVVEKKHYEIFDNPIDSTKQYALIPISYYQKPTKALKIKVHYMESQTKKSSLFFIKIEDGKYKKETIQVSASKVNPTSKEVQKRTAKEYNEAMKIYSCVSEKNYLKSPFIMPMQSKITSDFGKARIYNGSLNGYHSGTDFRAKVGTPIIAVNDAKVVLVKDRFYSGGTVILDHGEGIYTCYFHMSKFDVKENQLVKKGELLGLSGESGRVTGPHLHFSARIHGVQVDPLQLMTLLNNNLLKGNSQL